jgi:acyl-CoA thioesterase-1
MHTCLYQRAVHFLFVLVLVPVFALDGAEPPPPTRENAAADSPAKQEWEQNVRQEELDRKVFQVIEEDPGLPRVLLIGDSISVGYTLPVRKLLEGKANLLRIPVNGGPTSRGVEFLSEWLGTRKWDVIHFNWGLHDIKRLKDGKVDVSGGWQVPAEQYEKNLEALVAKLEATGAKLIWGCTTPVPEGAGGRIPGDEIKANAIAERVMKRHGIPMDDLYAHVLPRLGQYQRPANVHFTPEGYDFLATRVAQSILDALETGAPAQR